MLFKHAWLLFFCAVSPCWAAVVRVDPKSPAGSKESGQTTCQTLAEATGLLKDGDELIVAPGTYREALKIHGHSNITVRAAGAILDGSLLFSAGEIAPVAGQQGMYTVKIPQGNPRLIMADGHVVLCRVDKQTRDEFGGFGQGNGPLTPADTDRWIWDSKARQLVLNFSSHGPPHEIAVTGRDSGVELIDCHNVRVYGVTSQHFGNGVDVEGGDHNVVQNCLLQSCMNGITLRSDNCYARSNTILDDDRHGIAGGGQRNTIEQNLIERCGHDLNKVARFYTGGIKRNHGSFEVIDYNLVTGQGGASVWGDLDCIADLIYGNSVAHSSTNGFYIEWTQRQNNISYNSAMDCGSGVMFRCSQENIVRRNWFFDTTTVIPPAGVQEAKSDAKAKMLGISFLDTTIIDGTEANILDDNLVQVAGDAVAVAGHDETNKLAAGDTGFKDGGPTYDFALTNQLIGNYYTRPQTSPRFGEVFKQPMATLEDLKQKTGWEAGAHVGQFTPEIIWNQLPVWWPVPCENRVLWMPIIVNGDLSIRDRGDNDDEPMGWKPSIASDEITAWTHWSRYGGFTPAGDANQSAVLAWHKTDARDHGNYLEAIGLKPAMPKGGVGWRGVMLPVVPGTTFTASLEIKASNLKPFVLGGGVKGGIVFTDSVGTVVGQEWLTDTHGDAGISSNWKKLERDMTVPPTLIVCSGFSGSTRWRAPSISPRSTYPTSIPGPVAHISHITWQENTLNARIGSKGRHGAIRKSNARRGLRDKGLIVAELLETRRLFSNTYWVANGGTNQTGYGTQTHPFGTIAYAVKQTVAGDTVNVEAGTYRNEEISFPNSGTSTARITLQAAPGAAGQVFVLGSAQVTGWTPVGGSVYSATWDSYFPTYTSGSSQLGDSFYSGPLNTPVYTPGSYLTEVTSQGAVAKGTFYINHATDTVYLWTADSGNPANEDIEGTNQGSGNSYNANLDDPLLRTNLCNYLTICGLDFTHFSDYFNNDGNAMVNDGEPTSINPSGIQVSNNVFYNDTFNYGGAVGLWVNYASNNLFVGDTYTNCGDYGMTGTSLTNCTFKGQTLAYNDCLDKHYNPAQAGGMKICDSTGTVFDNNTVDHNGNIGIWFDVDNTATTIENNTSHDNTSNGMQYEISFNADIKNNVLYSNGSASSPAAGLQLDGSPGSVIEHNTIYGNYGQGIYIKPDNRGETGGTNSLSEIAYGNTIKYNIIAYNQVVSSQKSYQIGAGDELSNSDVLVPAHPESTGADNLPINGYRNIADYNIFYATNSAASFFVSAAGDCAGGASGLLAWQKESGQDAHSYWENPFNGWPSDLSINPSSHAATLGNEQPLLDGDITDVPITPDDTDNTYVGSNYGNYWATTSAALLENFPDNADISSSGGQAFQENLQNLIRVTSTGTGVSGAADSFHFAGGTLSSDGSGSGTIVTRLTSLSSTASSPSAGVMLRDSTSSNSPMVALMYSLSSGKGTVNLLTRATAGATASTVATVSGIQAGPEWLKITRTGSSIAAYISADGYNWIQVGNNVATPLIANTMGGLAVASGVSGTPANAAFVDTKLGTSPSSGVRYPGISTAGATQAAALSLPSGYADADVAAAPYQGYAYQGGDQQLYVAGGGPDITGGGDHFNYAYQRLAGNQTILTQVTSQQATDNNAKAGPMFRSSTSGTDQFIGIFLTPTNIQFEYRPTQGSSAPAAVVVSSSSNGVPIRWLRVTRSGNTYTASDSTDGATWNQIGSETFTAGNMASGSAQILAGLAVTSHMTFNSTTDSGTTSLVTFSNTSIGSATSVATPAPPSVFAVARDGMTPTTAHLTWVEPDNAATSFTILRSTSSNIATAAAVNLANLTTTGGDDPNVVAGTTYYYWLEATNGSGSSTPLQATLT